MLFILGLVMLFLAGLGVTNRRRQLRNHKEINETPTSRVADIEQMSRETTTPSLFRIYVELKGKLFADKPLTAKFSQQACVYVRSQTIEQGEEVYTHKGSQKVRKYSKVITDEKEFTDFVVQDSSGAMAINPTDATIEAIQVYSKYVPLSLAKPLNRAQLRTGQRVTLGHQHNEWILPQHHLSYVLGEVNYDSKSLQLGKPTEPRKQFLISHRSETQLLKEKKQFAATNRNWSIVFLAIALGIALKLHFDKQPVNHLVQVLKKTESSQVADLKEMTLPPFGENLYVKVAGTTSVEKPLQPKFLEQPAIYVRTLKQADYRETYREDGETKTRTVTRTLSDNVQAIAFQLNDATGSIRVQPQGAEMDAMQVWNNYEPYSGSHSNANSKLLGYHNTEWIIPLGQPTFVVGTLTENIDGFVIQHPIGDEVETSSFVISHRPEASVRQEKQRLLGIFNGKILTLVGVTTVLVCLMLKEIIL